MQKLASIQRACCRNVLNLLRASTIGLFEMLLCQKIEGDFERGQVARKLTSLCPSFSSYFSRNNVWRHFFAAMDSYDGARRPSLSTTLSPHNRYSNRRIYSGIAAYLYFEINLLLSILLN